MKMLSNLKNKALGLGLGLSAAVPCFAATVDYSTLTSAVDFTQIITVVLGVAAVIVGFILVKNNIGLIMSFLKSKAK